MEGPEDQIGASRSNLVVAIHPERGVRAGGQLESEDQARRHVRKETGVDTHDLEVAETLRIEGLDLAREQEVGFGGQRAIRRYRHPDHDAPVTVEVVTQTDIVPLGLEVLVLVESRRRLRTADIVVLLILAPILEEDSASTFLLLGHHVQAADVEHAAPAGAGVRVGCREADERSEGRESALPATSPTPR